MATIGGCKEDVIRVDGPNSNLPKFIEWNVDMNVTVPRSARYKLLHKLKWLSLFVSIAFISMVLWQTKNEIQEMNHQICILNRHYDYIHQRQEKLNSKIVYLYRMLERIENQDSSYEESKFQINAQLMRENVNYFDEPIRSKTDDESQERTENRMISEREDEGMEDLRTIRSRRSLKFQSPDKSRNVTTTTIARLETNVQSDLIDNFRSARIRRDEGRGKKRMKMNRRPKRSRGRLVPLMATFLGAVPEQHVIDSAIIGPWVKSIKNESKYSFNKFHLVDDRKAIEVTIDGLYMISTQIYYFGEYNHHSYWILLNAEGASASQKLVKCAAVSAITDREVSCYTSIVLTLNKGDRIYVQQQERNRLINLREGYSYIQFILLSTNVKWRY